MDRGEGKEKRGRGMREKRERRSEGERGIERERIGIRTIDSGGDSDSMRKRGGKERALEKGKGKDEEREAREGMEARREGMEGSREWYEFERQDRKRSEKTRTCSITEAAREVA